MKKRNPNWPQIPDHPNRLLITGAPGSGKTNALLNIINHQPDIDKIHLYPKDPYEAKYQLLILKKYWIIEWYGWYLWKYWWIWLAKNENIDE